MIHDAQRLCAAKNADIRCFHADLHLSSCQDACACHGHRTDLALKAIPARNEGRAGRGPGEGGFESGSQGEALPPSPAAGQRIFFSGNAGCKTGNTYSIPRFSNLFPEEKSLAASSCRRGQSFPAAQRLPWPRSLLAFLCGTRKEGPRQGSGSTCRCLSTSLRTHCLNRSVKNQRFLPRKLRRIRSRL